MDRRTKVLLMCRVDLLTKTLQKKRYISNIFRLASLTQLSQLKVYIDGRYYDVTNMRHPGGSVINFYSGKEIDASEAFMNFHIRSKKAKKLLASLPSRYHVNQSASMLC
jgi:cytochrome b involved in lipid metabolism